MRLFKLLTVFSFIFFLATTSFARNGSGSSLEYGAVSSIRDASTETYPWEVTFVPDGGVQDNGDGTTTINLDTALVGTFLRLDTSNDPLTNNLTIQGDLTLSTPNAAIRLEGPTGRNYHWYREPDNLWVIADTDTGYIFVQGIQNDHLALVPISGTVSIGAGLGQGTGELLYVGGTTKITGDTTLGGNLTFTGSSASILASSDLKILPNAGGNIILYGDVDVGDDEDGRSWTLNRMAVEGDDFIKVFIEQLRRTRIESNRAIVIDSDVNLQLQREASGDIICFGAAVSGENPFFQLRGFITAASGVRHTSSQVSDITDRLEETRQDANILGKTVNMPFTVDADDDGGSDLVVVDTAVGLGTNDPLSYDNKADALVIKRTGGAGLSIVSGTANDGTILFADGIAGTSAAFMGGIQYFHNTDEMYLWSGGRFNVPEIILDNGDVGIGTTSGIDSILEVDGPIGTAIETVTGDTTLDNTHSTLLVNASGNVVITLPSVASSYNNTDGIGRTYRIKKIDADADTVTIDGDSAEEIDGELTAVLTAQWESIDIQSSGVAWFVL
ncbi:hypothetical protein LCGC14_0435120 [marine sediment metagenome]|uniref:Uncharacterized protein n=1 Tax=marine sediment metagenome TaxID=412755 RepID=A0A0F9SM48_9ZZZZ